MEQPQRKQLRLEEYDYSESGGYFVTICTHKRAHLLGQIIVGNGLDRSAHVHHSPLGNMVKDELENIQNHFPHIAIDKYIIMPNHIHAIILVGAKCETERSRPFPTISTVIGLFKSGVSRKFGHPIWQKSYHDHIIRNHQEYLELWQYIENNPTQWELDQYY